MKKQPIIGAQNRCFQQRSRHHSGPWGNELNIKVLEFNQSKEDQMLNKKTEETFFCCCF